MNKRTFWVPAAHLFFIIFTVLSCASGQESNENVKSLLDVPPTPSQVQYSPEDGSTVTVNPPPFTWLPVRKGIEYPPDYTDYDGPKENVWEPVKEDYYYTLQISKDRNFNSDVITRNGIDMSSHPLDETLYPGKWFWRYGVETEEDETIFSNVRSFIVPPDARELPFPDIQQALNSVPEERPRLFIHKNELESYRERALRGDLRETVAEIKNEIDPHFGVELPPESKWVKGTGPEFGENSWTYIVGVNREPIELTEKFGLIYLLTGDKKYGEEARRRVMHFIQWEPDGPTSDRSHNQTNYNIVDQGTRAFDWAYDLFTPEERELVTKNMRRRAEQMYHRLKYRSEREYHAFPFTSHEERVTGFMAQAALAFAHEWEDDAEDFLQYALTIHWNLYPTWAKEDGGWHQGPPYWASYQSHVQHLIIALNKATGINLMQKEFFRNTPYYIMYTHPPYARRSPFGDFAYRPPAVRTGEMIYSYATLLNDPYLRWYADYLGATHPKNILGVFVKNDDLEGKPPTDLPQTRFFPGIGLASIHTAFGDVEEDIHFMINSNPYGGVSHGHADQNSFTIEAFGEALAIPTGYRPWYGSDHHLKWSKQTISSNNITFDDGKGQEPIVDAKGEVLDFESNDRYDYFLGDATQAYMGELNKAQRHVIHIRPGVFIMYDDLEAPDPVTFEWRLHALSEMDLNESEQSILISEGDARLKVRFLQAGDLDFDQFTGFPYPPEDRGDVDSYIDNWHFIGSTDSKTTKATYISLLAPFKKGQEPDIQVSDLVDNQNEVSLNISIDGKTYSVSFVPEVTVEEI